MDDRGTQNNSMGSACDQLSFCADAVLLAQFYPSRGRSTLVEPILRLMAGILSNRSVKRLLASSETAL